MKFQIIFWLSDCLSQMRNFFLLYTSVAMIQLLDLTSYFGGISKKLLRIWNVSVNLLTLLMCVSNQDISQCTSKCSHLSSFLSRSLKVDLTFISPFHFIFILFFIFDLCSIFRSRVRVKWQKDHAVTWQVTSDDTDTSHMI